MLTEKDYCDAEITKALESLGMNVYTSFCGIDVLKHVPLYEAQKWLREERKIEVVVLGEKAIGGPYYADIYTESGYAGYVHKPCEKYEEALSEGVRNAIEILKDM